jgi:polar amino acid transport system substrate-binding protein
MSPLSTRDVAERFKFSYMVETSDELLKDPQIQAVIIATRHNSHARLAVEALKAGKAIHVEKPLAMNMAEMEEIIQTYGGIHNQSGKPPFLSVGFNRRFAPMIQMAIKHFDNRSEPLAMNFRVNAGYIPLNHWTQDPQQGGGRVIGELCHFVDLMQFVAGADISQIFAQGLPNAGKYLDDNITVNLKLSDGSVGNILYIANGDSSYPKEYIEIFGEGKVALINDFQSVTLVSGGKKRIYRGNRGDKGHEAEMVAWVSAILTGNCEPVPFSEALKATKATFSILTSLNEGRLVSVS